MPVLRYKFVYVTFPALLSSVLAYENRLQTVSLFSAFQMKTQRKEKKTILGLKISGQGSYDFFFFFFPITGPSTTRNYKLRTLQKASTFCTFCIFHSFRRHFNAYFNFYDYSGDLGKSLKK